MAEVVSVFAPVVATPLTTAAWLTAPNRRLGGARPIDALRAGDADRVVALARRAAADLRH